MPSTIVLALALTAPLPSELAGSERPRSAEAWRQACRDALQTSARRADPDYARAVPRVAAVYAELAGAKALSHSERSQMRRRLKGRLEEMRDRLLRSNARRENESGRAARMRLRGTASSAAAPSASLAGPLDERQAQVLIELIQNTIAPESWEVNGGLGSIRYYPMFQALVVRQTGEVHHQLGGGLGQLRR
ncbi:MAG TPA: hypothetical protein VML55_27020 [Planctomycetaceae bacterium]|nr:hypothetical protein [Planctomycetaceae bacterium]